MNHYHYELSPEDRDEQGYWWPRLVWPSGEGTHSMGRIPGGLSYADAWLEVAAWNATLPKGAV